MRYCTVQDVADLAGRDFSGLEQHVASQVIDAAEQWIDTRVGHTFAVPTVTERLPAGQDYLYLSGVPVQEVVAVEVRTRAPGDSYTSLGESGDGWELIDGDTGLLSVPGMAGYDVFVEYIPRQSVTPLLREATRRLALFWLRPNLLDVPPGTVTYRAGQDVSITFDQKAIPSEIVEMVDNLGSGFRVPFA